MTLKQEALNRIKVAEDYLKHSKIVLEQEKNPDQFFLSMQLVEFARDSLSDASAVLRNEL